jgi:serine/threonine protein kinase
MDPSSLPALHTLSPRELVDLILVVMLRRPYNAILLEPSDEGHRLYAEPGGVDLCHPLPAALADAVSVRFLLLAGLDLTAASAQFGRLTAKADSEHDELMIGVRPTARGFAVELWRLADTATGGDATTLDQYELQEEIGRGGTGIVYRALHRPLRRQVAIKILHPRCSQDPLAIKRFIREARAASKIIHSGVVAVYDFGVTTDGRAFLVMELVEGRSLRSALKTPFQPERSLNIARQLAEALAVIHEAGVVHRDLKPENIFLSPSGSAKIGDFGAARDQSGPNLNVTQPGLVFGTPAYMSPEHIQGSATDQRTDIYALGCILYEMLYNQVPFPGKSVMEMFIGHISHPIPLGDTPHGPLPGPMMRILQRSMAKQADERYQDAREMLADLDRAMNAFQRGGWRRWLPI